MRWDALFNDLEGQWEASQTEEFDAAVAEAIQREQSRLNLVDRLRAQLGERVKLTLRDSTQWSAALSSVGEDWIGGDVLRGAADSADHVRRQAISSGAVIPLHAVLSVEGLPMLGQEEHSAARRRMMITAPLRALCRGREQVRVSTDHTEPLAGVIAAVGRDHLDLIVTGTDVSRGERGRRASRYLTLPFARVLIVESTRETSL